MLRLIFKIKNRIIKKVQHQIIKIKIFEWKQIYNGRFLAKEKFTFGNLFSLYFDASSSVVEIGKSVSFRDFCTVRSGCNSKLLIGDNVFFNSKCSINCFENIEIGNDCQFGEGVQFYDHNHAYKDIKRKISEQGYTTGNIRVGNNCWVGSNVIILKNVIIGNNVIIGAGCIVNHNIADDFVVFNQQEIISKKYYLT